MTLISFKHYEHIALKQVIDPQTNMIFTTQWRNKLLKDLYSMTHFKIPWIGKQCKDKWNCVNGDYKKIYDYDKSTRNNISY
jgi:hypothetical protein